MMLLRAYGCPLYDKNGNFTVNTPEGIRALEWIREMDGYRLADLAYQVERRIWNCWTVSICFTTGSWPSAWEI